ncbi:MAG: porin OmpA [Candidatus Dasytiphilus stammeri]
MKKKTAITIAAALYGLATTIALASSSSSYPYNPDNYSTTSSWYTGAKIGWSQYHDNKGYYGHGYIDGPNTKGDQLGTSAILGYQINPCLGLEFGYDLLGHMKKNDHVSDSSFNSYGLQMSTKLSYPITKGVDAYTRLGGMMWKASSNQNNPIWGQIKDYDTGFSPLAAIGIEYALSKKVATRLDYQWVNNIGNYHSVGIQPNNGMLSLGVTYRLHHGKKEPLLLSTNNKYYEPTRPIVVKNKHFTLKSDVLFNFDKAKLKPEGKHVLNLLYSKIISLDPNENSTIIVGYTDHIGSVKYNQKLSEKRAQVVANYLIFKGISKDKIYVYGMGENNSITGQTCKGIKGRALIRCLSPDRRVEIEVKGIKTIIPHI